MNMPTELDYGKLGKAILAGLAAEKAAGTTPTTIYGHGPGGLFSNPGVNPDIVNAFSYGGGGLWSVLPWRASQYYNELLAILTGQTEATGSQPTTACADCIQPGSLKLCHQTVPFGQECMDSQVIEITKAGQLRDRADMTDFRFIGDPLQDLNNATGLPVSLDGALRSESKKKILEMVGDWYREYGRRLYTGNPANTAGSTGNIEYNGLDILINTGYRDAITGTACPAADSIVRSAGGLNVLTGGSTAVADIVEMYRYLKLLAEQTGNSPATWAIVMRPGLYLALTEIWPCSMLTYRCVEQTTDSNVSINVDGTEQNRLRQEMRAGQFLWIDGDRVRVVQDPAIAETQPVAGTYESDIYFVPLTFAGGRVATYMEYFNLQVGVPEVMADFAPGQYKVTPNGRFIINFKPSSNWCVQIGMRSLPRLVLRTPFLAARLTDLRYTFTLGLHERTWFNDGGSDGSFYADGGGTNWNGLQQSYYTPTA